MSSSFATTTAKSKCFTAPKTARSSSSRPRNEGGAELLALLKKSDLRCHPERVRPSKSEGARVEGQGSCSAESNDLLAPSRREFLKSLAAAGAAASPLMKAQKKSAKTRLGPRIAVIGAGAFGGW